MIDPVRRKANTQNGAGRHGQQNGAEPVRSQKAQLLDPLVELCRATGSSMTLPSSGARREDHGRTQPL